MVEIWVDMGLGPNIGSPLHQFTGRRRRESALLPFRHCTVSWWAHGLHGFPALSNLCSPVAQNGSDPSVSASTPGSNGANGANATGEVIHVTPLRLTDLARHFDAGVDVEDKTWRGRGSNNQPKNVGLF